MSDEKIVFELSRERFMALVLRGLEKTRTVVLTVDAGAPGVVLPPLKDELVSLHYSLHFVAPPIPDLRVDLAGVLATLSFDQKPFETFVPWSAVRQIDFDPVIYPLATVDELDKIAVEHLRGLRPMSAPREQPRRLRRITQVDVFSPQAAEPAIDPEETSRAFAERGLRAVK